MLQVLGESSNRQELEARFLSLHCPFAKSWAMTRDRRVTRWTAPGGTVRVLVEVVPFEYKDPGCVAGLIGDALTWNEAILQLRDGEWRPTALIRVTKSSTKKALARRRAARRSA